MFVSLPLWLPNYNSAHKFNKQMSFSSLLQHFPPPFALADIAAQVFCVCFSLTLIQLKWRYISGEIPLGPTLLPNDQHICHILQLRCIQQNR